MKRSTQIIYIFKDVLMHILHLRLIHTLFAFIECTTSMYECNFLFTIIMFNDDDIMWQLCTLRHRVTKKVGEYKYL